MAQIQDYQDLVLDSLEVVEFQLIRNKKDLEDADATFAPAMSHQIFGQTESIFGYRDLRVRLLYTAGPMHIYLGIEYDGRVDELSKGEIKADDVVATIAQKLPDGCYFVNMDEFLKTLDKADKFQPFGEKLCEFTSSRGNDATDDEPAKERQFEIYYCDCKVPAFLRFFQRLQTFVLWFVDAASYIDIDDPQWCYFVCYEKYKNENGAYQYATVGYTTVYKYFAFPQNIRPRLSQMLILPPFQRLGIGTKLLETIYKYFQTRKDVVDITVEDPSDDFQRMRNYVDAKLCKDLKSFGLDKIKEGFKPEMTREARETFKINPRQCRKVYEIVRFLLTDVNDTQDYTAFRLAVKARLNAAFYKQMSDIRKLERAKLDTEWLRARLPSEAERHEQLQREYEEVEKDYKLIVERLKA